MRCSKCEFENPAGMKFCGKCSTALGLTCPDCLFENPPGFHFCGQCAAALTGAGAITKDKEAAKKPASKARFIAGQLRAMASASAAMESSAPIRLVESSDQYAPRLCFGHATQLLKSGDAADKRHARYILVAK
jgi:Double zinc ribbon